MAANIRQCKENLEDLCWDNPERENIAIQYLDSQLESRKWIEIYQGTGCNCSIPSRFSDGETIVFGLSRLHQGGTIPPPTEENQNEITLKLLR